MNGDRASTAAENAVSYAYRPSLLGAPLEFRLTANGIDWAAGSRSGHVPFHDIRRVRMSYKPANMQSHRFKTEVWAAGAPKLEILSSSWKSLVEQERQDMPYRDFVLELHRRVARAAPPAQFDKGGVPVIYWPGLAVFVGVSLGLAAVIVRAMQAHAWGGAAFIGAFLFLFLWQGGNFFRRNKPGVYSPDAPPAELLPL